MSGQNKVTFKKLLINLLAALGLSIGIVTGFFYIVLPTMTDHGESITVPDLKGMHIDELENFLKGRNLSYRITKDSGYSPDYKPLSVLKQFPAPYSKVKEKRKIYVTLNSAEPPNVKMPKLTGSSVKSAQMVLKTLDLKIGKITYVPDFAANNIMKQIHNGKVIPEGTLIPKGSEISLEVGDGLGNQTFLSPDLKGLSLEEARFVIIGQGLKVGTVKYEASEEFHDKVLKQWPVVGTVMRIGRKVDLWVAQKDTKDIE